MSGENEFNGKGDRECFSIWSIKTSIKTTIYELRIFIDFEQLLDITGAISGEKFTFTCDASEAGWGEAKFDLVHRGRSLPHTVREVEKGIYMITFTPQERGKHRVYVYYNGIEVKGTFMQTIVFFPVFLNYLFTCETAEAHKLGRAFWDVDARQKLW